MLNIGSQISTAKGFEAVGRTAADMGANTFQIFMRNPRGAGAKALNVADIGRLRAFLKEKDFAPVLAHAPYTLNPCSADPHIRALAAEMIADDLARMEHIPGNLYNFHPGSRGGQEERDAIVEIAAMLNVVLSPGQRTTVLVETMAGKGSEVGGRFEDLARILELVKCGDKVGVCMDSCHMSDAGYDLAHDLDGVLEEFDRVVGLGRLKAFHLNDSMGPRGCRKDRHAPIGGGSLGIETAAAIVNHPALKNLPFILETPLDLDGHAAEIALLRSLYRG